MNGLNSTLIEGRIVQKHIIPGRRKDRIALTIMHTHNYCTPRSHASDSTEYFFTVYAAGKLAKSIMSQEPVGRMVRVVGKLLQRRDNSIDGMVSTVAVMAEHIEFRHPSIDAMAKDFDAQKALKYQKKENQEELWY
jgi:single-stranded DNA-binding protein